MNFGYKKLYIDGQLTESTNERTFFVICPADEQEIASIAWAGKKDTEHALAAAHRGFYHWSALPLEERLRWIDRLRNKILERADQLRISIMYEMGKTWAGTEEDLTSLTDSLQFYAEEIRNKTDLIIPDREGTHEHRLVSQPLGVVVAFLAYNFPLLNLGFKLGPALAAGCSIIIKPSEYSPLSAYLLGEICAEIEFPAGVINVLCGDVQDVGIPLCESRIPRLITMIGSTATAQKLIEQSSRTSLKRYSMECGGNAPFIVFDDADLEQAVTHGAVLKTGNTGQICVAPNRFYVQSGIIDEFIDRMAAGFKNTKVGFGRKNAPDMGPLANRQSVERITDIVRQAVEEGGELIYGGRSLEGPGYYVEPTLIRMNDVNAAVLQREIFGPVAIVLPFSTREEVIRMANNTEAGLASYVYSQDEATLNFFTEHLEFGEIHLNGLKFDIYLPHGGIKNSGISVDCSAFALDDYLIRKRVTKALEAV